MGFLGEFDPGFGGFVFHVSLFLCQPDSLVFVFV
jgi:hypothetical protein